MRLLLVSVLVVFLGSSPAVARPARTTPPRSAASASSTLEVLRAWDARRASAWAHSDVRALRRLYLPRSTAADADVRLLQRYTERGLVVRRLYTQVFAVQVLRRAPSSLRIQVLDRVAGGAVYDGSRTHPLGATAPASRVVELRRSAGRWLVASVSEPRARWDRGPRPAPHRHPGR